ncbi:MAG TPA: branched-chain amino acid ABC transporter permease [Candidatus Baltobacteraceae bacterium]|jgi:branched-chain amino acid transport system permease protein
MTRPRLTLIVCALALVVYPFIMTSTFGQRVGVLVLLAALSGTAWNIVGGYAEQVSIGHAVFYGIGAYVPLLFYTQTKGNPVLMIPFAMALAALVALCIGIPTFRLRGHYFSMATLALGELFLLGVTITPALGGASGLSGPVEQNPWELSMRSPLPYYYVLLVALALMIGLVAWLERNRVGYYLRAIQSSERAARSLGVPVYRYKLIALMISAACTALAGSFYALFVGFVNPDSVFGLLVSVQMVIVATLGGAGTLYGPLLGAVILVPTQEWANATFGGGGTGLSYVVYGAVIMVLTRFEPGGLLGLWNRLRFRAAASA